MATDVIKNKVNDTVGLIFSVLVFASMFVFYIACMQYWFCIKITYTYGKLFFA